MKAKRPPILRTTVAALLAILISNPVPAEATVLTWTGLFGNLWETPPPPGPTNWIPNTLTPLSDPTVSDLVFNNAVNTNSVNNAPPSTILNSITFGPAAANFILSGTQVLFQGGGFIVNNSSLLQTIAFAGDSGAGGLLLTNTLALAPFTEIPFFTINAAAGDILITSDISFASDPLTLIVTGPRNTTITGGINDTAGGAGTLVKTGTGILALNGNNTFLGSTTVNGGTALVNGSLSSVNTFVNPGGTLGGRGIVRGNVFNSGNVSPGGVTPNDRLGTLTVGNYTQNRNGTLTIEISGKNSGQHDLLAVQGRANLDGTLRLVDTGNGVRLKVGDKITFLTAGAGVVGEFSDVINPFDTGTILKTRIVYDRNAVSLEAQQGSFREFAKKFRLSVNQRAVAGGLDKIAFRNRAPKVIEYLNTRPLVELPGDFDRIAPDELASIFDISVSLANVQTQNLQRRTSDLRSGARGFSAGGFAAAGSGPNYSGNFGAAGPTGSEGKDTQKTFTPPEDNRWGTFLTGVGEWVDVDGDGNARGYDVTTGGFTVGLDYKLTPNAVVGISAGYAGTGADLTNDGRVLMNGGKLGLYGTYFTGGFYVDAAVNGGYNSYDTRRSALQGAARGRTDGGELNVLVGTGYDFQVGGLTVGPTANFQYTYVGIDGYTERGSLAPLNVRSQSAESMRSAIGFKASYDWKAGGVIIKPELRAAWQHEYGDAGFDVSSSFAGSPNSGFTVRGPELGRDSLLLGAGFAVLLNERTATYFYYDTELGRDNYEAHNVSGGIRVAF